RLAMTTPGQAQALARRLLRDPLPRRWAHTQGVAAKATTIAPALTRRPGLLITAAWLHDIGYTPAIAAGGTGFHPLDGARYLRDTAHAEPVLCRLVAHHSCALDSTAELGLAGDLAREFPPPARKPRRRAHLLGHDHQPRRPARARQPAARRDPRQIRPRPHRHPR